MNDDERRIITQFVERIAGVSAGAAPTGNPWGGSVPNTQARPNLPPVDRDADMLISDLFNRYPEARYRITQTAFVQDAALVEAQNRIRQLEWEVQNAQAQAQASAQPQRGGLFGMFGGGGGRQQMAPMPPPPQPVYPPNYNPGMLQPQRGGSGFLGTALTTAAGVAGGMVLGNMLMNSFSGHHGAAAAASDASGAAGGAGAFGQEAVPTASPWTDPGAAAADNGWGGGEKSGWGGGSSGGGEQDYASSTDDATGGGYDTGSSTDDAGGGGYDEDV